MKDSTLKFTNIICKIDGCLKNVRLKSYGLCSMHETRFRTSGTFKKTEKIKQELELPNGIKITKPKEIELLKIILEEVKHRRLCGYWFETGEIRQKDLVKNYIMCLLNDEIKSKRKNTKAGIKTRRIIEYLDAISRNYDKKWGLISEHMAHALCNVIKMVCDKEFCPLEYLQEITFDPAELIDIIQYEQMHGLKYDDKNKIIEFADSGEQILEKNTELKKQITETMFPRDCHLINLHYERFLAEFIRKK